MHYNVLIFFILVPDSIKTDVSKVLDKYKLDIKVIGIFERLVQIDFTSKFWMIYVFSNAKRYLPKINPNTDLRST